MKDDRLTSIGLWAPVIAIIAFLLYALVHFAVVDHPALQAQCLSELGLSDYRVINDPVVLARSNYVISTWIVSISDGKKQGETMLYDRDGGCVFQGVKP